MRSEFQVYRLNGDGMALANVMTVEFSDLVNWLETVCQPGREFSLAKTKLEEACFFAKKAMAQNHDNQEKE